MESIDKLRKTLKDCTTEAGIEPDKFDTYWITAKACDRLIDEIEAEIAERYMLLPVDRSGETWHIGDKFAFAGTDGRKHICTVSGVSDCKVFFYYDEHSSSTKHRHFTARAIAHVKPRTLENIVADAIQYGHNGITGDRIEGKVAEFCAEIRELLGGDAE